MNTAGTGADTGRPDDGPQCWCCGTPTPPARLLSLGARPEATVCLDCAAHLHRRARARQNPPAAARHLHAAAERLRGAVTHAGLHRKPVIGPVLRWINRRAPF